MSLDLEYFYHNEPEQYSLLPTLATTFQKKDGGYSIGNPKTHYLGIANIPP